jgi:hypothetical protein
LASGKGLNDDHCTAGFWAILVCRQLIWFSALFLMCGLIKLRFCVKQTPDYFDPVTADTVCKKACVADEVESGWQDMDQETAY